MPKVGPERRNEKTWRDLKIYVGLILTTITFLIFNGYLSTLDFVKLKVSYNDKLKKKYVKNIVGVSKLGPERKIKNLNEPKIPQKKKI